MLALLIALLLLATASGCGVLPAPVTAQPPPSGSLVVSFIDVGQGDGVLVQSGGESYLLDAGKAQAGPKVVDFLRSRGVESLDGIVVSNPDADYIGGFEDVLDAFEVANVYLSDIPRGPPLITRSCAVRDEGSEVVESRAGMRMEWGGTTADVIAPPPDKLFSETNDNSVGILLTHGSARVLLAGDAEKKSEEYMSNGSYTGPLTLIRV